MPCLPLPSHLPSHLVKVHAQEGGTVELACKVKFGHIICPIFVCPILHLPGYFCLQGKVWCNFFHNICCCLFLFVLFCIFRDIFARKILTSFVNHFLPFLFVLLCIFGDIFACKVNFGATFCLQVMGHLAYGTVCRLSFDTFFLFVCCLYNLVFSGLKPNFQGFNFFQAFLPCQNCILLKRILLEVLFCTCTTFVPPSLYFIQSKIILDSSRLWCCFLLFNLGVFAFCLKEMYTLFC